MSRRRTVISVLAVVGCLVAAGFTYAHMQVASDRIAAAKVCSSVPLNESLASARDWLKATGEIRFDVGTGASWVVALGGPAYCHCTLTVTPDGLVRDAKAVCQH